MSDARLRDLERRAVLDPEAAKALAGLLERLGARTWTLDPSRDPWRRLRALGVLGDGGRYRYLIRRAKLRESLALGITHPRWPVHRFARYTRGVKAQVEALRRARGRA